MAPRQIIASYLIVQAVGTAAWWCLLLLFPRSINWFKPASWPDGALLGFWLGDFVLLIGGSILTAAAVRLGTQWASTAIWGLAAAVWYPTLYCIGVSIMTGEGWIASAMMVSMAGLTLVMATVHGTNELVPALIRATQLRKTPALAWTFAQLLIFWSVFLWILPMGIVEFEQRLGWPSFSHAGQTGFAAILFLIASVLGLWSGTTMAIAGAGTPLPTATAPKLVLSGPYRFVRNPMALAGILQGIAVGWMLGSFGVMAYALVGAIAWHLFVRPVEESDLMARFGEGYADYRKRVRLWIPTLSQRWSDPAGDAT